MDEMQNVTANVEEVVTPQETTEQVSTENVQTESVQPTEKAETDVTQTQAFSQRLKEQTQKAIDAEYDRLYGQEYGIHSKADYDQRIAEQQEEAERARLQEEIGVDPEKIKPIVEKYVENHPVVKSAREQTNKMLLEDAASQLSKVAQTLGIKEEIKTWQDVEKLPKYAEIRESILKGNDIIAAAKLAYFDDVIKGVATTAEQEAIQKITANGASSPGSLATGGEGSTNSISSMSKADFKKIQEEVLRGERKKI